MDDLEATVRAAVEKSEAQSSATSPADDAAPAPEAVSPDKTVEKASGAERARDEVGRFAKPVAQDKKSDAPTETGTAAQAQAPTKITPPINWKGAGKTVWDKLPQAVQKELADDYAQRQKMEADSQQWGSVITPERATAFQAQYGSTQNAIKQLLAYSDYATKDPAGFIRLIAQESRIDLASLIGQAQQADPSAPQQGQGSPLPPEVQRELGELRNSVQQMQQQTYQRQLDAVMSEVNAFKADANHPYYNDVEQHMIALLPTIQGNPSERLQKAYEQAVWANPEIRQAMIEQEHNRKLQQNAATVSNAKRAAGLNGSPAGAQVPSDEPRLSLEETVRRAASRVLQ